jgi:hypothetical protein
MGISLKRGLKMGLYSTTIEWEIDFDAHRGVSMQLPPGTVVNVVHEDEIEAYNNPSSFMPPSTTKVEMELDKGRTLSFYIPINILEKYNNTMDLMGWVS